MIKKLTKTEVTQKLKRLSGWKMVKGRNAITKTFKFSNFQEAFGWMTSMAIYAFFLIHHVLFSLYFSFRNIKKIQ